MSWSFVAVVGGEGTLVLGAAGGQNSLLWACLGCMACGFGLLSLKTTQQLIKQDRTGGAGLRLQCLYSSQATSSVGPSDDVIVSSCAFLGSFYFL